MKSLLSIAGLAAAAMMLLANAQTCFASDTPSGIEILGNARFTVVTPYLIRMEYQKDAKFIDAQTIFAVKRDARFTGYQVSRSAQSLTINTGKMVLQYQKSNQPFSANNLKVKIYGVLWTPGMANDGNLGGTSRTLDGISGPFPLDDGVLSTNGWYLLDNSADHLMVNGWVQSKPKNAGTDWYLFGYGKDYQAALRSLTAIGGAVPMPRRYQLGVWYSRYWPYTSEDYRNIVGEFKSHDFPLDVMVMDMDWHRDGWTGWSWNRKLLPDAEDLLKWFHTQDIAVTMNLHPADGVGPHEDSYETFMRDMGEDPATKKTIQLDVGNRKYIDTLFKDVISPLEKNGVDFWWLDWQQYVMTLSIPDLQNLTWLNQYFYKHAAQDGKRGAQFSRWAGWGDHRNVIHFSGDSFIKWEMLAFEVPFTSTAGNMGCFFWSHDIGGHQGTRNDELYTRWVQFGVMSAAQRSHSTRNATLDRRPWTCPKWAEDSMRMSFHLRSELFPYIYSSVRQSNVKTIPLTRPMYIEYPKADEAYTNPQQYLFGDSLLVAPVASEGVGSNRVGKQVVWFPDGEWYNWFTGEKYTGSQQAMVTADINEFPLYARGGVPIPMQPYQARMATSPLSTLVVRCYPGVQGRTGSYNLYEDDGISQGYKRGEYAETKLSYKRMGTTSSVEIGAVKGEFKGQVAKRSLVIEFPATKPASQATIDGKIVKADYDAEKNINRVTVPAQSIKQRCVVTINADLVDFNKLKVANIVRRAGLDTAYANQPSMEALLQAALPEVTDPQARQLLLESCGIGIISRNTKPYMYPQNPTAYLYVPKELVGTKSVEWSLIDNGAASGNSLATATIPMHDIQSCPELSTELEPTSPSSGFTIEAKMNLMGQSVVLQCPSASWDLKRSKNNVAVNAKVSVSSVQAGTNSAGINDGLVDGYPGAQQCEWCAGDDKVGAWAELNWDAEQKIDRVWLFDRPNTTDHILSGVLTFSDGSSMDVGELPNDSTGVAVNFPAKSVKWVRFTVKSVSSETQYTGLAEIAVFRAK